MKRVLCFILILFLFFISACGQGGQGGSDDSGVLLQLQSNLRDADRALDKVESIINQQLKTAALDLDVMNESLREGGAYEEADRSRERRAIAGELDSHLDRMRKIRSAVERIPLGNSERIDQTIKAARHYFSKATAALEDLMSLYQFYLDLKVILKPVDEFEPDAYDDSSRMIEDLYLLAQETLEEIREMNCPPFLKPTFIRYLKHTELTTVLLESLYSFLYSQDQGTIDHLRIYSHETFIHHLERKELQYQILMTEQIVLQNEHVLERIHVGLSSLGKELDTDIQRLLANKEGKADQPFQYSYLRAGRDVRVDYRYPATLYPSLYPSIDAILILTATSEGEDCDVLFQAEIPGFTQTFEQSARLTEQVTTFYVKPPLLTGDLDLASSKDAQLTFSVTDAKTGYQYVRQSLSIKLMSRYDFILWEDEFGSSSPEHALAWLTPESEGILNLRRLAIDWLDRATDGHFNTLQGYQLSRLFGADEYYNNVLYQILGIQGAMSDAGVRYNMGSFSMTPGWHQRVLFPDDVLSSKSGVCIETALVMASAIQSAGMHAMLVFPPGHAQVAVETWHDTGEYFLIETTILPYGPDDDPDLVASFLTSEEWESYLADPWGDGSGPCQVVDCDLAVKMGLVSLTN